MGQHESKATSCSSESPDVQRSADEQREPAAQQLHDTATGGGSAVEEESPCEPTDAATWEETDTVVVPADAPASAGSREGIQEGVDSRHPRDREGQVEDPNANSSRFSSLIDSAAKNLRDVHAQAAVAQHSLRKLATGLRARTRLAAGCRTLRARHVLWVAAAAMVVGLATYGGTLVASSDGSCNDGTAHKDAEPARLLRALRAVNRDTHAMLHRVEFVLERMPVQWEEWTSEGVRALLFPIASEDLVNFAHRAPSTLWRREAEAILLLRTDPAAKAYTDTLPKDAPGGACATAARRRECALRHEVVHSVATAAEVREALEALPSQHVARFATCAQRLWKETAKAVLASRVTAGDLDAAGWLGMHYDWLASRSTDTDDGVRARTYLDIGRRGHVAQMYEAAIALERTDLSLAERSKIKAQLELASSTVPHAAYVLGKIAQDADEAARHFAQALHIGPHAASALQLALLCMQDGARCHGRRARDWLRVAAMHGNAEAMHRLALSGTQMLHVGLRRALQQEAVASCKCGDVPPGRSAILAAPFRNRAAVMMDSRLPIDL